MFYVRRKAKGAKHVAAILCEKERAIKRAERTTTSAGRGDEKAGSERCEL